MNIFNNWVADPKARGSYPYEMSDEESERLERLPGVGDEVEAERNGFIHYGVVTGIIRNCKGYPVCYRLWRPRCEGEDDGCVDYVSADDIYLHEDCGIIKWSLGRYGYKAVVEDDPDDEENEFYYFYNEETGDVICL